MTGFEVEVNAALLPDSGSNATKDPIISKDVRIVKIARRSGKSRRRANHRAQIKNIFD